MFVKSCIEPNPFRPPVVVTEQLYSWLIELQTRDFAELWRASRIKASKTYWYNVLLAILYWIVQVFPHDQHLASYSRIRCQTDNTFPSYLWPSCRDVSIAVIITILSWWSCCRRRHSVNVVFQPSSSSSCCDNFAIIFVTIAPLRSCRYRPDNTCHRHHCWRHHHAGFMLLTSCAMSHSCLPLLLSSWHADTVSPLSCRRHLLVIVPSDICDVIAPSLILLGGIVVQETSGLMVWITNNCVRLLRQMHCLVCILIFSFFLSPVFFRITKFNKI